MKSKYIFLVIIIAAAFIGYRFYSNGSVVKTAEKHDRHGEEKIFSDIPDHGDHEVVKAHEGHDHDAHDQEALHNDANEDSHDDHGHEAGLDDHEAHDDDTNDGHEGHGDADDGLIELMTDVQAKEAGLTTDTLKTGAVSREIKLTGEVTFNQDRIVHLVPRIPGVVASVNKNLGDPVKKGDELAVIHSRELTDIKSEYLSAIERIANAKINFEREQSLWQKKITPERQFLESKQAFTETQIALQAAERKLHALGFTEQYIAGLPNQPHEDLFKYRLNAPANGIIIEKHIVQGELVTSESPVFIIADTTSLWIDLQVYPGDLAAVKTGQKALVTALDGALSAQGTISFISSMVNRETRTALARVELPNTDNMWREGLFATAIVTPETNGSDGALLVPKSAVQNIGGKPTVFIVTAAGYLPVTVATGQSGNTHVEILSGVNAGQTYVSNGSYELKAKMVTSQLDGHAGHGH